MKYFSRFFYKLRGGVLEHFAGKRIFKLKDGEYRLQYNIPYVSQYESPDPFWAPKLCGMACFKMILLSLGIRRFDRPKLVELGKKAMAAGCYKKDPQDPKRLIGMLHAPFLKFAEQYGFGGKLIWYIGANAVAKEILDNHFIIASVSNQIGSDTFDARPENKQGHLVLIHGFKVLGGEIRGFYIHNPSGFYNESQENHFVSTQDFTNCFSGRIIVLWEKNFQ